MSEQHTPEPWLVSKRTVFALNERGTNIFSALVQDAHTSTEELEANARRVVASVNACAGIPTAELERAPKLMRTPLSEIAKQRDELLAALEKAANTFWKLNDADIHAQEAEAVIASVKDNT